MRPLASGTGKARRRSSPDELLHRGIASVRPELRSIELPSLRGMHKGGRRRLSKGKWWLLAAVFIASGAGYGIWVGGRAPALYGALDGAVETLAVHAGFGIKSITIDGQKHISDAEIAGALGASASTMMLGFDTDAAKARLEHIPWVRHAQVMRLLPSTLQVVLEERVPYAVWQSNGVTYVIDAEGVVLSPVVRNAYPDLPLVVGAGAEKNAASLFDTLSGFPELKDRTIAALRVGDRRWTLVLNSGIRVMLPDDNVADALQTFATIEAKPGLLSKDVTSVDLRLADRVTLRLQPADETVPAGPAEADVPTASTKTTPGRGST